jgi:hypothetical protein
MLTDVVGGCEDYGSYDPFCPNLAFPGAEKNFPFKSREQHKQGYFLDPKIELHFVPCTCLL